MGCKLRTCNIENCTRKYRTNGFCQYHYNRSDQYKSIDQKRYRNDLEFQRERSRIKSRGHNPKKNRQGIEYRTRIAKVLGLTYTQFTHQLQLLKKKILQRDEFCVYCGGKAEIVHHELERKYYPELTLIENNMVSSCEECHKLQHGVCLN